MAVAAAIDNLEVPGVVGCIAGDDTVMCAIHSVGEVPAVMAKIQRLLKEEQKGSPQEDVRKLRFDKVFLKQIDILQTAYYTKLRFIWGAGMAERDCDPTQNLIRVMPSQGV